MSAIILISFVSSYVGVSTVQQFNLLSVQKCIHFNDLIFQLFEFFTVKPCRRVAVFLDFPDVYMHICSIRVCVQVCAR